ncbi:MAG: beta-propeller fold lactonase family protein [Planctomycetota bacterium]
MHAARLPIVAAALSLVTSAVPAQSPALTVASPYAVLGQTADFTVQTEPGAAFLVLLGSQPARLPLGGLGTLFLSPVSLAVAGGGVADAGGVGGFSLPLAALPSLEGVVFYAQALALESVAVLTNAVPLRFEAAAPSGSRAPRAVVVTPDGAKAYVAHQLDGVVTVIDAVADVVVRELPLGPAARAIPHRPLDVAVDPEGRHVFVANAAAATLAVLDVATDSVVAQLPVPRGCHRVAFDFSSGDRRIYVSNQTANAILRWRETVIGTFTPLPSLPVLGDDPEALVVLPDGRLLVGNRGTFDLEAIDPAAAVGATTVARTALTGLAFDLILSAAGDEVLVPTCVLQPIAGVDGVNALLRVRVSDFVVVGSALLNSGTDYVDVDRLGDVVAVTGAGSGSAVVADADTLAELDVVDLAPGQPNATPQDAALVRGPGGAPTKLYVVNQFRETVRPVLLGAAPPFALGAEIAMAHSGVPRVALSGALTPEEDGEWFFRSVEFFNGSATNPNPVTCQTCHVDIASVNLSNRNGRQSPAMWGLGDTAPYASRGTQTSLLQVIQSAFRGHGRIGGALPAGADRLMQTFLGGFAPPESIYRQPDGSLTAPAAAGKAIFAGIACTTCHAEPAFIPLPPTPLTLTLGIGTGLIPANVPSLRGAWSTPPYLHDGSAVTLRDVLTINPLDVHGLLAGGLSPTQLDQLVAYLQSL